MVALYKSLYDHDLVVDQIDVRIVTQVPLTAPRTITLPHADASQLGQGGASNDYIQRLEFFDILSTVGASNTLSFAPVDGDRINGTTSPIVINYANAYVRVYPLGGKDWYLVQQPFAPSGGGGGSPGGANTDVQFNDNGSFGGNDGFTYDITTTLLVQLTNAGDTLDGGQVQINGGPGGATSGAGGQVVVQSGNATTIGTGGRIFIAAGDGGSTSGDGGRTQVQAGSANGGGVGGALNLFAGTGIDNNSGGVFMSSGDVFGNGDGGVIDIIAGVVHGDGTGGPVLLEGGRTNGSGTAGSASLLGGAAFGTGNGGNVNISGGVGGAGGIQGHILLDAIQNFADDAAAAAGGVPITGLYRTASVIKIRMA